MTNTQNDARGASVDWGAPIEAVHDDGRVVRAFVDWDRSPDSDGDHWLRLTGEPFSYCAGEDSDVISPMAQGWRIRNVTPAPTAAETVDPALVARMVVLVRGMARPATAFWGGNYSIARAIAAELPDPVDPDEQYARDLIREQGLAGEATIDSEAVVAMIAKARRGDGK